MIRHDEKLLDYFRSRPACEVCRKVGPVEPHHIKPKGIAGGSRLDVACNLIAVCRPCHDLIHGGKIVVPVLWNMIAKREGLQSGGQAQEAVWRLLREPRKPIFLDTRSLEEESRDEAMQAWAEEDH